MILEADIDRVSRLGTLPAILSILRKSTGLRVSLVARVTQDEWAACAVLDDANFGLKTGDRLDVATTY